MNIRCFPILFVLLIGAFPLHSQTQLEVAFPNLSFVQPLDLAHAGDGTNRLFVVERRGIIWVFENETNVSLKRIFLDIRSRVNATGSEEGLLGLAFHPGYANNGYFYVDYTAASPGRTVIARYSASVTNPDSADATSEFVVLEVAQPFSNHNGGRVAFGPEGYLYIGMGDGGSGGDPLGHGQNLQTLLGALLRIDVNATQGGKNYAIPPDNPFAGNTQGYREEIYAWGLRNPWRFSFDTPAGRLWLADVGQNAYEEIDIIEKGKNYGWNIMEGFHCFNPPSGCDMTGLELPIWEYDHSAGRSVTGGFVYRGARLPSLFGKYVYADFITGTFWCLEYDGVNPPTNTQLVDTALNIASFGVDAGDELYACAFDGKIYRFRQVPTGIPRPERRAGEILRVGHSFPNPFNPKTAIEFRVADALPVEIRVFDARGRLTRTLGDRIFSPGSHRVEWDGRDDSGAVQPSGIYFCRLTVNGTLREVRRMVLLK